MAGAIVVQNLVYVVGAVIGIVIGTIAVTLRHRPPKSMEANMASFHRGLRAVAPDAGARPHRSAGGPLVARRPQTAYSVLPAHPEPPRPMAAHPEPVTPEPIAGEVRTGEPHAGAPITMEAGPG